MMNMNLIMFETCKNDLKYCSRVQALLFLIYDLLQKFVCRRPSRIYHYLVTQRTLLMHLINPFTISLPLIDLARALKSWYYLQMESKYLNIFISNF